MDPSFHCLNRVLRVSLFKRAWTTLQLLEMHNVWIGCVGKESELQGLSSFPIIAIEPSEFCDEVSSYKLDEDLSAEWPDFG